MTVVGGAHAGWRGRAGANALHELSRGQRAGAGERAGLALHTHRRDARWHAWQRRSTRSAWCATPGRPRGRLGVDGEGLGWIKRQALRPVQTYLLVWLIIRSTKPMASFGLGLYKVG